jgi:alpha-1,3-rhamnosyl/mannosyltransferase
MTVLVDATALTSGHRWRGIGTYVRHLVEGLVQRLPDQVDYLTLGSHPDGIPPARNVSLASAEPPLWPELWPIHSRSVRDLIRRRGSRVYHFTSAEASVGAGDFKTVATVYDLIPLQSGFGKSVDPRQRWRAALYQRYLRNVQGATRLIAISRATAAALSHELRIPRERIDVIPLGIDARDWRRRAERTKATLHERYALPERFWLTVTSPNPNKGWPDLVRALAVARASGLEIPLVLAGYWLSHQQRQLSALATTMHVSDLVHFLGYVDDDVLPALYSQALGFVFTSRREGFALPVLEAMAAGTPLIVSDEPAVLELADGIAAVFPRGEASILAERMMLLAGDEALRSRLAAQGLERSAEYSWERTVEQTVRVYDAV